MDENLIAVACSRCFRNRGLILDAMQCGREEAGACPNCGLTDGVKLGREPLAFLANRFFVDGSFHRTDFGGAPIVQFNEHQKTSIDVDAALRADISVFEKILGVGFFYYGPRLWMVGENDQLRALEDADQRGAVVDRIVREYPARIVGPRRHFIGLENPPSIETTSRSTTPHQLTFPKTGDLALIAFDCYMRLLLSISAFMRVDSLQKTICTWRLLVRCVH